MATYSNNTTTKEVANARGTVTTPTNSNVDIFTVPAGYRYKIVGFMLARAINTGNEKLRVKSPSGNYYDLTTTAAAGDMTAIGGKLYSTLRNGSTNAMMFNFNPPLELEEGQGFNYISNSVGGGPADWEVFGETLLNTP